MTITAAGLVRQHGPLRARCPGSHQPPANSTQPPQAVLSRSGRPLVAPLTGSATFQPTCLPPRATVKILKRIPKASRLSAGRKLATILEAVVGKNDHASWDRLFRFSSRCLRAPKRGGQRRSLATVVNRQLEEETDSSDIGPSTKQGHRHTTTRHTTTRYTTTRDPH